MTRLLLVVHRGAGGGRAGRAEQPVLAALRGWADDVESAATRSLEHAEQLARDAVADGRVVLSLGGDGLAGRVAGACADADGVFAALPGGRGNDFVRCLGMPRNPVQAAVALAAGTERRLDLGRAVGPTGRALPFLGIASLGFDSDVQVVANRTRLVRGSQVYTYAALRVLAGWRPARFSFCLDDAPEEELVGWSVAAANSAYYGGGMRYAPSARLDDGQLDVVLAARSSKRRFLSLLPKVFSGGHISDPHVSVRRAARIRVDADRPFQVYADGDPVADLPAELSVRPKALRTLVPSAG